MSTTSRGSRLPFSFADDGLMEPLGVSRPSVYRWLKSGDLPRPIVQGGTRYWNRTYLVQWLGRRQEAVKFGVEDGRTSEAA